jgi:predicted regulator of Ras-like GTPase activity (Roadblock/LC7/MglB family)
MEQLRDLAAVKAVLLIGPAGIIERLSDNGFNVDVFVPEYATLLRIAQRTSDDADTGALVEHIMVSEKAVIVARSIRSHHFLIVVADDRDHLGRARYELKRVARELERIL